MSCDATSLINAAYGNGYDKLSERDLKMAILASACAGSGTGGAPDSINVPGPPAAVPPAIASIVVDSNGRQWMYWGGAWH